MGKFSLLDLSRAQRDANGEAVVRATRGSAREWADEFPCPDCGRLTRVSVIRPNADVWFSCAHQCGGAQWPKIRPGYDGGVAVFRDGRGIGTLHQGKLIPCGRA
jgi:predicted RNA-binding Zn-ribbon protein involved in translation (DUF1610 family)